MQAIPRNAPGSYIDFKLSPTITTFARLASLQKPSVADTIESVNLNTDNLMDFLSIDFARALKDFAAVLNDLKRLATLGDLPLSLHDQSTLRVRFPGCDVESVERLCDEVGVQRGVIRQDEDFETRNGTEMALLFPFAPSHVESDSELFPVANYRHKSPDMLNWRHMMLSEELTESSPVCINARVRGPNTSLVIYPPLRPLPTVGRDIGHPSKNKRDGESVRGEKDMEEFNSETESDYTSYWRDWFISSRGNEYFCEIDEEYLTDRFNLTGLNNEVQYYQYALDLVTDVFDLDADDDLREQIEKSARHLYGLVHARYIVTTRGLAKMLEKYKKADFGKCPRVLCNQHPLLPMGLSDLPGEKSVSLYCAKCEDIYNPKSSRHASIDGAYFGSSFHSILFQVYPAFLPEKSLRRYDPRVFGFRVHASAALSRWQNRKRDEMKVRLRKHKLENPFVEDREFEEDEDGIADSGIGELDGKVPAAIAEGGRAVLDKGRMDIGA
ncbi:casein kinase II beta 2 subunit [Histoplasma mississippiense (nom. inval.)]|uniref:casein kinase II beta 2 subunit n=1 Tax=Ajellomyces capsulatus (strain NAm1 / WU24) TaxID=2059318 RepID=UPI000157BFA6|nr:casein kinase II beta 2 subunit [Histoplasma mississippiense (nom. inval.)]EDN06815.1 casein kinase II beta 2 subunit [Histoplasma mississippiense (nom. inval.)]